MGCATREDTAEAFAQALALLQRPVQESQEERLRDILSLNRDSQLLRQLELTPEEIDADPRAALRRLPLTHYGAYREMTAAIGAAPPGSEEAAEATRKMTGGQIIAFFTSSGTTGEPKLLPFLMPGEEFAKNTELNMAVLFHHFPGAEAGYKLSFPVRTEARILEGSGMPAGGIGAVVMHMAATKTLPTGWTGSGAGIALPKPAGPTMAVAQAGSFEKAVYCHWLCALARREEVSAVQEIFSSTIVIAFRILLARWETIAADLEAGRLAEDLTLPGATRQVVDEWVGGPQLEAAAALRAEVAAGEDGLLLRLFPGVKAIFCATSGTHAKYLPRLRQLAPAVPVVSSMYVASESRIGLQAELLESWDAIYAASSVGSADITYIPMLIDAPFMEFIHESAWDEEQPAANAVVPLEALRAGERYEVVLSTPAGLLRYRIGDVIRCVGCFPGTNTPRFVLEGRKNCLSIHYEKTHDSQVVTAVLSAASNTQLLGAVGAAGLGEFMACEVTEAQPPHYRLFLELHTKPVNTDVCGNGQGEAMIKAHLVEFAAALDTALGASNPSYSVVRAQGRLGPVEVGLVHAGAFQAVREAAFARGAIPSQMKMPVLATNPEHRTTLEAALTCSATAPVAPEGAAAKMAVFA